VSELATALGTLELTGGHTQRARKLFRAALEAPTDNALAQAEWASRNRVGLALTDENLNRPRSFEARAQELRAKGEWEPALVEARNWLYDEPFSRHAAGLATYIASVPLEHYEEAVRLARVGLSLRPRDPTLLNNLAFALASSGDLHAAEEAFNTIPIEDFDSEHRPFLLATQGLLRYRRGDETQGSLLYQEAIADASKRGNHLAVALAHLYHAREALLAGSSDALELWAAAQTLATKRTESEVAVVKARHSPGQGDVGASRRR
jgi:tetratricopeptide (TPR) repeat protein